MVTDREINKDNKWEEDLINKRIKPRPVKRKKKVPNWLVSNRQRRILNGK